MRTNPGLSAYVDEEGYLKEDAVWAYKIWNDSEMGQYLSDEAKEEIDYE